MASTQPKILIMSAPFGSGHKLAATAVMQELSRSGALVEECDAFSFLPAWMGQTCLAVYGLLLKYWPEGFAMLYKWSNGKQSSLKLRNFLNKFMAKRAAKFIQDFAPDAVVVTHATPAGMLAYYKEHYDHNLYVAAITTDYFLHDWWLCKGINTYFVADNQLTVKLLAMARAQGLPQPEVLATGIPIRRHFSRMNYLHAREMFHWEERTLVCLFMGGGEGLLPMVPIIETLRKAYLPYLKIVAVAGNNASLEASLEQFPDITVYGFTDALPDLMIGADIVVTKAGGLTLTEALTAGTEIIIYQPLPGAEAENTAWFLQEGLAQKAVTPEEILRCIQNYKNLPETIRRQKLVAKKSAAKPLAAQDISEILMDKIHKQGH
jgi:processive 1,2-diacylglycerol beta-glucosyltransferase